MPAVPPPDHPWWRWAWATFLRWPSDVRRAYADLADALERGGRTRAEAEFEAFQRVRPDRREGAA